MSQVRAKFKCVIVRDDAGYGQKLVSLSPVIGGSDENKSFAKYTPVGSVELNISYETQAADFFEVGKEYYLDFTKAE